MTKVKFKLQGHEKFFPREGWIYKGLTAVQESKSIFLQSNAPDTLGVGSNMVKSIRYWLKTLKLTDDSPQGTLLTPLGKTVIDNDPYVEDIFTIWILHSNLVKNESNATTWHLFFNRCSAFNSSKNDIEYVLSKELSAYTLGDTFSSKSLSNDIDLLLNMYSRHQAKDDPEEKNSSIFSQLSLLKNANGVYTKTTPDMRTLNEWIILYELSMYSGNSIAIDDFINGNNGIKSIYQLPETSVIEFLEKLEANNKIILNRTAGLDMIYVDTNLIQTDVLKQYYKTRS